MEFKFIERGEKYDGSQLVSLGGYLKHKILGDSVFAWIGPCDIPFEHMVDGEDLNAGAEIRGDLMVHFIVEKFDSSLLAAVGLQRLLTSIVRDELMDKAGNRELALSLYRVGDDIYARVKMKKMTSAGEKGNEVKLEAVDVEEKACGSLTGDGDPKLSISIATQSPISSLIHFAVNVTNKGTPVRTLSLEDLEVDPKEFARNVLKRFSAEVDSIKKATVKTRWVK